jgi:hypothetical protein
MAEYKEKMEKMKIDEENCKIYPSTIKKKSKYDRRKTLNVLDDIKYAQALKQPNEEYSSANLSNHKYVNDYGS